MPVGRLLADHRRGADRPERPAGSCIGVVVTDAPVDGAGCARLARRIGLGLARTGSVAHHGSGEIFLGCGDRAARWTATAHRTGAARRPVGRWTRSSPPWSRPAEEAVLNSMLAAPTTVGRDGNTQRVAALPASVLALLADGR